MTARAAAPPLGLWTRLASSAALQGVTVPTALHEGDPAGLTPAQRYGAGLALLQALTEGGQPTLLLLDDLHDADLSSLLLFELLPSLVVALVVVRCRLVVARPPPGETSACPRQPEEQQRRPITVDQDLDAVVGDEGQQAPPAQPSQRETRLGLEQRLAPVGGPGTQFPRATVEHPWQLGQQPVDPTPRPVDTAERGPVECQLRRGPVVGLRPSAEADARRDARAHAQPTARSGLRPELVAQQPR